MDLDFGSAAFIFLSAIALAQLLVPLPGEWGKVVRYLNAGLLLIFGIIVMWKHSHISA